MLERYVRRDSRVYDFSTCKLCGVACGVPEHGACKVTTCLACGSPQCVTNGLGRGTCGICLYGLLSEWGGTDRPCGYKKCPNGVVARAKNKRIKFVCKGHLTRQGIDIRAMLNTRDTHWVLRGVEA